MGNNDQLIEILEVILNSNKNIRGIIRGNSNFINRIVK